MRTVKLGRNARNVLKVVFAILLCCCAILLWHKLPGSSLAQETLALLPPAAENCPICKKDYGNGCVPVVIGTPAGMCRQCDGNGGTIPANPPLCNVASSVDHICDGGSVTFTCTTTPGLGLAPLKYAWSGPNGYSAGNVTTITINPVHAANAGPYKCTVSDANGCSSTCSGSTSVYPSPAGSVTPSPQTISDGGSATFTCNPSGGTPFFGYNLSWTGPNGYTAGNVKSITINPAHVASSGLYICKVSDYYGCTIQCFGQLIVNPNPTCSVSPSTQKVCDGGTATFTSSLAYETGTYTSSWSGPNGFTKGNGVTTISIHPAHAANAGTYTWTVKDAKGYTTQCSGTLIVNPNPTCSISLIPSDGVVCDGGIADFTCQPSGGTAPYTYSSGWAPAPDGMTATFTINPAHAADAGTYTCNVTDANGCTTKCAGMLKVNPPLTCKVTPVTKSVCNGGSITFTGSHTGGTSPYHYSWYGPSGYSAGDVVKITINPVNAANTGSYTFHVTDGKECTTTCTGTLTVEVPGSITKVSDTPITSQTLTGGGLLDTVNYTVLDQSGAPLPCKNVAVTESFDVHFPACGQHLSNTITDSTGKFKDGLGIPALCMGSLPFHTVQTIQSGDAKMCHEIDFEPVGIYVPQLVACP